MASAKIEAMWDMDGRDHPVLVVEKKRGKINLAEVEDLLRYSKSGAFQGNYVLIIRAGEATCGGSGWMDEEEPKGDQWELYQVEAEEPCPVCGQLAPPFEWCPMCGESLTGKELNAEQAMGNAEFILESMKREAIRMIESTDLQETRKAWYHSHLGSLDFARQMGLITEERRQQLYKKFQREANNGKDR